MTLTPAVAQLLDRGVVGGASVTSPATSDIPTTAYGATVPIFSMLATT